MKSIIKLVLLLLICYIAYRAYNSSGGFMHNVGKETKKVVDKGKTATKDFVAGFKEK